MAGARRSGREAALQMLFQMEAGETGAEETIALFWRSFEADPEGKAYGDEIVRGVAAEVSKGLAHASLDHGVPVAFGVLTTDTIEQAVERAGTKAGNKGWESACSAIEMVSLSKAIDQG